MRVFSLKHGWNACALVGLVTLSACGGGTANTSSPLPRTTGTASPQMTTASIRLVFGGEQAATASSGVRPKFVSPSTQGVLAQVFAHGTSTQIGSTATDVSPGSSTCSGSSSTTRTCIVPVPAPVGLDDYVFTLYDKSPASAGSGGSFPAGAHILGTGSLQAQTIVANTANVLTAYISGTIASIGETKRYVSLSANGKQQKIAFVIDPTDFDNNPITAGANDTYANAITATMSETGGSGHAALIFDGKAVLGNSVVLHQSSDTLALSYDGQGVVGYGVTVTLSASGAPSQQVAFAPVYVTSTSPFFKDGALAFTLVGETATLSVTATGAPSSVTYTVTPNSGCNSVASVGNVSGGGASASVVITSGNTAGTACTITFQDSTGNVIDVPTALHLVQQGVVTNYAIPTSNALPTGTAAGPDGNVWFTETGADKIGKMTVGGVVTEYNVPTAGAQPNLIAAGPDGNLWFTEEWVSQIAKITTSGKITEYPIPTPNSFPQGIAAGPDGNLWFTELTGNAIGKITPSGTITEYPLPTSNAELIGITAGPDGNVWFAEAGANQVGKITPTGTITEFPVAVTFGGGPTGITTGPDGNLWFTLGTQNGGLAKITTAGAITEFPAPLVNNGNASPSFVVTGPDHNLWFTEYFGGVGKITTGGTLTTYPTPAGGSFPLGITVGSDSNIWFAEQGGNAIGTIKP